VLDAPDVTWQVQAEDAVGGQEGLEFRARRGFPPVTAIRAPDK